MADDTIPQDDPRALTEGEQYECAADWSDYRKDYGVSYDDAIRKQEFAAFRHAWRVEHTRRVPVPPELPAEKARIADRLRMLANEHGQQSVYMLSYDADFLHEVANRIYPPAPAVAVKKS